MNDFRTQPPGILTRELLEYWVRHPEMEGTVETMVEWWLLEQRIHQAVEQVRSVLGALVARGFVIEQRQADGRVVYRLNPEKGPELGSWLNSQERQTYDATARERRFPL